MAYTAALKNGFRLINRNWQLLLLRIAASVLSCIGLVIFIGIPLAVAVILLGFDLKDISSGGELFALIERPSAIADKYMGLFLLISAGLLIYFMLAAVIWLYVVGGSLGIVKRSLQEPEFKFRAGEFFSEGRRLFMPLMGYTAVLGVFFIAAVLVFGVLGGLIAVVVGYLRQTEITLALFLGVFMTLLLLSVFLAFIVGFFAVSMYGFAALVFERPGALGSLRKAFSFLKRHPSSFWGYCLMLSGFFVVVVLFALAGMPFNLIPVVGMIILIPFQFLAYVVQRYLGLVMSATVMSDYWSFTEVGGGGPPLPAAGEAGSTGGFDTSSGEAPPKSAPPQR